MHTSKRQRAANRDMDIPVESAISSSAISQDEPGKLAGKPLEEWNAAYGKVESYFNALRVRNKLLLGQLVILILKRAIARAPAEPHKSATELAVEELDRVVSDWFAQVLDVPAGNADPLLSTRGRLALLLADMPGKWQDQFLRPKPWPEEFVTAMRQAYLQSGPDFQLSQMSPREFDLGPITTLTKFSRLPYAKMLMVWVVFALLLILLFYLTH